VKRLAEGPWQSGLSNKINERVGSCVWNELIPLAGP